MFIDTFVEVEEKEPIDKPFEDASHYDPLYINRLFDIIQDNNISHYGSPVSAEGLVKVPFEDIDGFRHDYVQKVSQHTNASPVGVKTPKQAVELLHDKDIYVHHRSCASAQDVESYENSALCVHYYDEDGSRKSVAIPKINYLYSLDELETKKQEGMPGDTYKKHLKDLLY